MNSSALLPLLLSVYLSHPPLSRFLPYLLSLNLSYSLTPSLYCQNSLSLTLSLCLSSSSFSLSPRLIHSAPVSLFPPISPFSSSSLSLRSISSSFCPFLSLTSFLSLSSERSAPSPLPLDHRRPPPPSFASALPSLRRLASFLHGWLKCQTATVTCSYQLPTATRK